MTAPSHPHEPRRQPLAASRASGSEPQLSDGAATVGAAAAPPASSTTEAVEAPAPVRRRSVLTTVALAVGVGLSVGALTYSVVALPLYLLAEVDADGLDRPLVRDGFFEIAVPAGLVAGLVAGIVVGIALARGGRLPTDRTSFHER